MRINPEDCRQQRSGELENAWLQLVKNPAEFTRLTLAWTMIGDAGCERLRDAFFINTTLTSLDLDFNNIGSYGAAMLTDALKYNTSLRSLTLSHNDIGVKGGKCVVEMLERNTSLTELNLLACHIGVENAERVDAYLVRNKNLQSIAANEMLRARAVDAGKPESSVPKPTLVPPPSRRKNTGSRFFEAYLTAPEAVFHSKHKPGMPNGSPISIVNGSCRRDKLKY